MKINLTRRNIGRLVLVLWAAALAWLARREFTSSTSASIAERTERLEPGAQYFAVLAEGRQIGQLNRSVDTLVDGVRVVELMVIDIPEGDSTRQLARTWELELSRSLRLRRFSRTVFGSGLPERLEGEISGDSVLLLRNLEDPTENVAPTRIAVGPDVVLPPMLGLRTALGNHLRLGERFELPILDLGTGSVERASIRVTAESTFVVPDSASWDSTAAAWVPETTDTIRAFRVVHDGPGSRTVSWIDASGALVGEAVDGGTTLLRSAFEIVGNNYRRGRRAESSAWRRAIPGILPLAASGFVPDTTAPARSFRYRGGDGTSAMVNASGGRQEVRGDTVVVRRQLEGSDGTNRPSRWLGPAWDLADPRDSLVVAATRGLGTAKTKRDSAAHLTGWVTRRISLDRSPPGFGTALNALRTRRGGPDSKARLLATLARAAWIPARVVNGVAVLPEGTFGHTWVELWIGRWVAADPTFGHFPASASLIRIGFGERGRSTDLVPLVGSARFLPIPGVP